LATVRILRSTTAGNTPSALVSGQIAINEADGKLFYRNGSGVVTQLATGLFTYAATANFPATGVTTALYLGSDVGKLFQWTGSVYSEVGPISGVDSVTDTELRALFVPAAPTSVTATAGNAQVSLAWTAPTVLSVTPITDYTVQYSSNSGSTWTTFTRSASNATSATVTGLINGTAYVFQLSATNGVGTGSYSAASGSVTPSGGATATLTSGGGANSWRWSPAFGFGSDITIGRFDDGSNVQSGWRTTFTPASKPSSINSATFTLPYTWSTGATAFTAVLRGAKLANAGQGLQGTSTTTASATGSVTTSNGTLTIDCTAVIAEIIGQAGWNPGNSIVLYVSGENASTDRLIDATDTAGSLVISYS
jgi:hypothetical protein